MPNQEQDVVQMTYSGRAYGTAMAMLPGEVPRGIYKLEDIKVSDIGAAGMVEDILGHPYNSPRKIITQPQRIKQISPIITGGQNRVNVNPTTGISPTEIKTRGQDETWYPGMLMSKGITAIIIVAIAAIAAWAGVTLYTNYISAKTMKESGITTTETLLE